MYGNTNVYVGELEIRRRQGEIERRVTVTRMFDPPIHEWRSAVGAIRSLAQRSSGAIGAVALALLVAANSLPFPPPDPC
jgi:hypothetical protein